MKYSPKSDAPWVMTQYLTKTKLLSRVAQLNMPELKKYQAWIRA
jgi:hypothetical protein